MSDTTNTAPDANAPGAKAAGTATPARIPPTIAEFKKWAKDCAPAAKAVLMARVFAEMERERVDAYILPIFQSHQFKYGARWKDQHAGELITKPGDLYLCDDDGADGDEIRLYYAECDAAHRAHGFAGPVGHCPALVAENLLMTTERLLIELAEPLMGIQADRLYGDNRRKYLELLIGSCAPFITLEKSTRRRL